jgi:hypothetical protein
MALDWQEDTERRSSLGPYRPLRLIAAAAGALIVMAGALVVMAGALVVMAGALVAAAAAALAAAVAAVAAAAGAINMAEFFGLQITHDIYSQMTWLAA